MRMFDLHTHTIKSDGSDSPVQLVQNAKAAGLALIAVTDHDTVAGVREAAEEGRRTGMPVLPGIEFDTEFDGELHILGLGIDIGDTHLLEALEKAALRREKRNREIFDKLKTVGVDAEPFMEYGEGTVTRLHVARAIVKAGGADTVPGAFDKYLRRGCVANVPSKRPTKEETIALIHGAGGVAVLAHPCKLRCDVHPLINELAACGLDGLEAWYPTSTEGQTGLFLSLCTQLGLFATCGSDYHGRFRDVRLGAAWREDERLERLLNFLMGRFCL